MQREAKSSSEGSRPASSQARLPTRVCVTLSFHCVWNSCPAPWSLSLSWTTFAKRFSKLHEHRLLRWVPERRGPPHFPSAPPGPSFRAAGLCLLSPSNTKTGDAFPNAPSLQTPSQPKEQPQLRAPHKAPLFILQGTFTALSARHMPCAVGEARCPNMP